MASNTRHNLGVFAVVASVFILLTLYSCASIGTPSGGPRDEDPPRYVGSYPLPYQTGFKGERLQIEFNELVNVKDAFTSVTFSPPSRQAPKVSSSGRKVIVQFNDTLIPNTTYNIDFGNSIEDVNESNKLRNFSFSFSTGDEIDTLMMSGIVLDAKTLEPQQGVLVGAYTNLADSAFLTLPFERVTRTDDRGRFVLRALKEAPYRVFALGDLNNDFHWDNPAELMAFLPFPVTPYTEQTVATDTLYNMANGEIDTIVTRQRTRFLPNNLLLQMFDFGFRPQYITNYSRPDSTQIQLLFNQRQAAPPKLKFVQPPFLSESEQAYIIERNERNDTITYWLNPFLTKTDTIKAALEYYVEQRGSEPVLTADTLTFITKRPKVTGKPRKLTAKQQAEDSIKREMERFILPSVPTRNSLDVYRPLTLMFPEPLLSLDSTAISIKKFNSEDSTWTSQPFALLPDSLVPRRLNIDVEWDYATEYQLSVDSLAAKGISGRFSRSLEQKFKTKERSSYASLILRMRPDTIQGFVEVLNSSDAVVQSAPVEDGVAAFYFLAPSDYYVRFIADTNGNGRFDPGDYENGLQPEETFYYPKMLSLKRYDRNEEWDIYSTPVDLQKPDKIKKNKPEAGKRGRREGLSEEENEEDDYFDVTRNPFDPNDKGRMRSSGNY